MASVTSSWLNVVTGRQTNDLSKPVVPAQKGALATRCQGRLLVMLGHYGWIVPQQPIHHPAADKHNCRIYIKRSDFRHRSAPQAGDEVMFFLYVDEDGLGAEDCYVVGEAEGGNIVQSEAPSQGWVNMEKEPCKFGIGATHGDSMNPDAQEFIPTSAWCQNQVCSQAVLTALYLADDSDDDDDDWPSASKSLHDDNSTRADSDSDVDADALFRFPPGLEVPPGLDPPPGLDMPFELIKCSLQQPPCPPGLEVCRSC